MLMLTSLTYVETEQYLVVLFLVTAPRLIVRAGRGHRYAHAFIWKNKELSVCLFVSLSFSLLAHAFVNHGKDYNSSDLSVCLLSCIGLVI